MQKRHVNAARIGPQERVMKNLNLYDESVWTEPVGIALGLGCSYFSLTQKRHAENCRKPAICRLHVYSGHLYYVYGPTPSWIRERIGSKTFGW